MQVTYVLEDINALKGRRYYVGRTNNMSRRMKEHAKDNYKKYVLVYMFLSVVQVEHELKHFGVTKFMNMPDIVKFRLLNMFVSIKTLKKCVLLK